MPKSEQVEIVNTDHPHLTPSPTPVFTLVHNVQGFEVYTLLCADEIVMQDREIESFGVNVDDILSRASETAADLVERTGFS